MTQGFMMIASMFQQHQRQHQHLHQQYQQYQHQEQEVQRHFLCLTTNKGIKMKINTAYTSHTTDDRYREFGFAKLTGMKLTTGRN